MTCMNWLNSLAWKINNKLLHYQQGNDNTLERHNVQEKIERALGEGANAWKGKKKSIT